MRFDNPEVAGVVTMKRTVRIGMAFLVLGLPGLSLLSACATSNPEHGLRAAIVDQLGALFPNRAFIERITRELEAGGFKVDVYPGDAVTVDLYSKLPAYGYRLIIFRVHSGLLGIDPVVTNKTWLYTNESYSRISHLAEQLDDRVTYAKANDDAPWCFAVSAEFIDKSIEDRFRYTAIIMMGCDGLHFEDMAQAFIGKGASTYIAWDASVTLEYTDNTIPVLIEKLCSDGLTVKEAVAQTMFQTGPDPVYGSVLRYYPRQSASKKLSQLIDEYSDLYKQKAACLCL